MILGKDGAKLSKRHGAVSVLNYRDEGFLPEALLNYLARLGWSHGDQEIFTLDEMVAVFDIMHVNKAAAAFDPEKLLWVNQQHMMRASIQRLAALLRAQLARLGIDCSDEPLLQGVASVQRERARTMKEMAENSRYFFVDGIELDAKAASKHLTRDTAPVLEQVRKSLQALPSWSAEQVHRSLQDLAGELGVGLGKVAQPLRVAVSGGAVSPPIDATVALVGRDRTLARIERALAWIQG